MAVIFFILLLIQGLSFVIFVLFVSLAKSIMVWTLIRIFAALLTPDRPGYSHQTPKVTFYMVQAAMLQKRVDQELWFTGLLDDKELHVGSFLLVYQARQT